MNKILFVDDEPDIIESFLLWLQPKYEVLTANDPKTALKLIKQHSGEISVAIVDMKLEKSDSDSMPESGMKLINNLKLLDDKIQVIILTGFPDNPFLKDCIEAGALIYVIKGLKHTRELLLTFIDQAFNLYKKSLDHEMITSNLKELSTEFLKFKKSIKEEVKVGKWFGKECVTFDVKDIQIISKSLPRDDDWVTLSSVELGQTIENVDTHEVSQAAIVEQQIGIDFSEQVSAEIGSSIISKIKSTTNFSIKNINKVSDSKKLLISKSTKKILSIPEPLDYEKKYVTKRQYQAKCLYDHYLATISVNCSACKIEKNFKFNLYVPTGKVLNRIVSEYSTGEQDVILT